MTEARRYWPLLALGLAAFIIALVIRAPASVWAAGAERAGLLPVGVQWETIQGSPWRGQVTGLIAPPGELGQVGWEFRPGALLRGRVAADLDWQPPQGGQLRGGGFVSLTTRGVRELEGELPATTLNHLETGIPVLLDGQLQPRDVHLQLNRAGAITAAQGAIQWLDAAAGVPRPIPLGEQQATLESPDERLHLQLASAPDAALDVTGWLAVDLRPATPATEADLELEARDHADPGLRNFLQQQLEPDPQGRYRWTIQPES